MNSRVLYLDVLRIVACLMVILMHSPMPGIGISSNVLSSISLLCVPCIGLFFMISGALLLPVKDEMHVFYKKRFKRIVFPALTWMFVYIIINILVGRNELHDLPKILFSIPFSPQGHGIMWFVYTLIGLYLIAPIVSPWLQKCTRKEIEFVLFLWIITLCYPYFDGLLDVNNSETSPLYYFSGYSGYFLLGYYIEKYPPKVPTFLLLLTFCTPVAIAVFCRLSSISVDFYSDFWYLSLAGVFMALSLFLLVRNIVTGDYKIAKCQNAVISFSKCTYGMYLIHILIMREFLWRVSPGASLNGMIQIIVCFVLTTLLSYVVVWLFSYLPIGDLLVGVHNKNKY